MGKQIRERFGAERKRGKDTRSLSPAKLQLKTRACGREEEEERKNKHYEHLNPSGFNFFNLTLVTWPPS